ncbi:MAG: YciI family protein [Chthoniobacteraceae bacterium]
MSLDLTNPPRPTGYLLLFRNTNWENYGLSEAEIRTNLDKVNAWFDGLAASGKLLSAQPLLDESVVITGKGVRSVTDGPFSEAKEVVGGYVLLNVESKDEAIAIAKTNPMHEFGLTTEVRATASGCPHLFRMMSELAAAPV